jgi:hypothetical protein
MSTGASAPEKPIQAARSKPLVMARDILLVVGVVTVVVNCVYFADVGSMVAEEVSTAVEKTRAQGWQTDEARMKLVWDQAMLTKRLTTAGTIAIGALFVVFGLVVQKCPVPITSASLVIYVGAAAMRAYLDPEAPMPEAPTLRIVVSVVAVVALAIAILAAIAYRRVQHPSVPEATATVPNEPARPTEAESLSQNLPHVS